MAEENRVQRWMAKRRTALVLSIVRGETSAQEAARKHGLTVAEVEEWYERFMLGAEDALRSRPRDDEALKEEQIKQLKQKLVSGAQQYARGLPNHGIVLWSGAGSKGVGALKRLFSGRSGSEISDELREILGDLSGITSKLRDKIMGRSAFETLVVEVRVDHLPNPNSRLTLGSRRDRLGMQQVILDWKLTALDKQLVQRTLEIVGEVIGAMDIGRLQVADWLSADDDAWPDGVLHDYDFHHMGTTRMSRSPHSGVVDANCRIHGLSNLYVASSSVFSTAGFSNPTLTIVALTLRLAYHLKAEVLEV